MNCFFLGRNAMANTSWSVLGRRFASVRIDGLPCGHSTENVLMSRFCKHLQPTTRPRFDTGQNRWREFPHMRCMRHLFFFSLESFFFSLLLCPVNPDTAAPGLPPCLPLSFDGAAFAETSWCFVEACGMHLSRHDETCRPRCECHVRVICKGGDESCRCHLQAALSSVVRDGGQRWDLARGIAMQNMWPNPSDSDPEEAMTRKSPSTMQSQLRMGAGSSCLWCVR